MPIPLFGRLGGALRTGRWEARSFLDPKQADGPHVTPCLARTHRAIYGYHITLKTTVYLDAAEYRRLKAIARARGRAPASVLREAVAEYTARHAPRGLPKSLGAFHSGRRDLGSRSEELLRGLGRRASL
jgi:hypothetical protein